MILYKYMPPVRVDVLENLMIRFTQPAAFNDPFECRPKVTDDHSREDWLRIGETEMERADLPEDQREYFRDMIRNGRFERRVPEVLEHLLRMMSTSVVALPLTAKDDDLLMWAHYAQDHEGFVLGFDKNHRFLSGDPRGVYKLTKVQYAVKRPCCGLSELTLMESYFTKSRHWEYEQEWRLFRNAQDAATVVNRCQPCPVCLFKVPVESIVSVTLGCRAAARFRQQVRDVLTRNPELQHVLLREAKTTEDEFRLVIEEVET